MQLYTETEERNVIIALKDGQESAFKKVFDQHFARVYTFSFRLLKNKQQAEEVVNDAFLNVWMNRYKLNENLPVLPYLYTITRRLSLNSLRNIANSQKAIDQLWLQMKRLSNETEEAILLSDLKEFTEKAVVNLPAQQQLVFRMSRYEGLSYDEIAERLNLSRNTVKNHLISALKSLRVHFDDSETSYFLLLSLLLIK